MPEADQRSIGGSTNVGDDSVSSVADTVVQPVSQQSSLEQESRASRVYQISQTSEAFGSRPELNMTHEQAAAARSTSDSKAVWETAQGRKREFAYQQESLKSVALTNELLLELIQGNRDSASTGESVQASATSVV